MDEIEIHNEAVTFSCEACVWMGSIVVPENLAPSLVVKRAREAHAEHTQHCPGGKLSFSWA